ncbi:MAG: mechanosensitive ion channel [Alphaproteobacteria bacterium]
MLPLKPKLPSSADQACTAAVRPAGLAVVSLAVALLVGLAATHMAAPPAMAQAAAEVAQSAGPPALEPPPAAGEQEIRQLIETLQDPAARARLIDDLEMLLQAAAAIGGGVGTGDAVADRPENGLVTRLASEAGRLGGEFDGLVGLVADIPAAGAWLSDQALDREKRQAWLALGWRLLIVLLAALLAEAVLRIVLRPARARLEARDGDGSGASRLIARGFYLLLRTVLDVVPIGGFAVAGLVALSVVNPSATVEDVLILVVQANVAVRVVMAGSRMVLAPRAPGLRLPPVGDSAAGYLHVWISRFSTVGLYGFLLIDAAQRAGLASVPARAMDKIVGLLLASMAVVFILQNRRAVAGWIGGGPSGTWHTLRQRVGDVWHLLAILYVGGVYAVALVEAGDGFAFLLHASVITIVAFGAALLVSVVLSALIRRGFRLSNDLRHRFPALEDRANRYLHVLHAIVRAVLLIVATLVALDAWGVGVFAWLTTAAGQAVVSGALIVVIVALLTLAIYEGVSMVIESYLARAENEEDSFNLTQRALTLLPLIRRIMMVVLVTLAAMVTLSEMGVDIAPLLAGAGVLGLAVGFGSQTLVKDVVTGLFILLEDQISVGDVAELGGHTGVIEAISIRTVRLRDLQGIVHIVPFGEVTTE